MANSLLNSMLLNVMIYCQNDNIQKVNLRGSCFSPGLAVAPLCKKIKP